jgi:enterobactin synthetase component D
MTELDTILFLPFVSHHVVRFVFDSDDAVDRFRAIDLPTQLDRAVPQRKLEYRAGRFCARNALRALSHEHADAAIGIGADGAPLWPQGIVGAITHTRGFAAAAVARAEDATGIGLDSERIVPKAMLESTRVRVAAASEIDALQRQTRLDEDVALTIVFSAKESIFKCLYRRVGRYFDFHDVAIVDLDQPKHSFVAELRTDLADLSCGTRLDGRFVVVDDLVHTSITMTR